MFENIQNWYRGLPDKKRYIEFLTAVLTIPVLITVIITNVSRINEDKKSKEPTPQSTSSEKIVIITQKEDKAEPSSPTPQPAQSLSPTPIPKDCKKEIGPIKIISPQEEEVVEKEPVCINIDYTVDEYCSVAWSYKLNDGNWSDYTSSPFCFSNLNPGKHELDLRVQSVSSSDELILKRTFYYKSKETPTTPTPSLVPQ